MSSIPSRPRERQPCENDQQHGKSLSSSQPRPVSDDLENLNGTDIDTGIIYRLLLADEPCDGERNNGFPALARGR